MVVEAKIQVDRQLLKKLLTKNSTKDLIPAKQSSSAKNDASVCCSSEADQFFEHVFYCFFVFRKFVEC